MAYPCLERNHRLSLRPSLRNQALELRNTELARDECDLSSGHDQLKTTIPSSPSGPSPTTSTTARSSVSNRMAQSWSSR